MSTHDHLSLPPRPRAPRALTEDELAGLLRIADVLIPRNGEMPAASEAPAYTTWLERALAARAEKFDAIAETGLSFATIPAEDLDAAVRQLAAADPDGPFQPVSAVLAGAYLMVPEIRAAIGYPGQHRSHPPFDLAVEEIMDGILDPVIERGSIYTSVDV